MEEEPSNNIEPFSELSELDSEQSDLAQDNSEQGSEEDMESQQEDEEQEQAPSRQRSLRSGKASRKEAQGQEEGSQQLQEGDMIQEQIPAGPKRQRGAKVQKPPERGQFYEMLYEIQHLIKIVEQEGNPDAKLVIVKWRNFAMSECTRQPLSYIKQIDLMKEEVQKLQEEFEQTKFAPESIVRVKAKIRQYLNAYRLMVYPPRIVDPSEPIPTIEVGGMGPLNQQNERRQITYEQLTRCQAAAFQSTRKKFQLLFNDATEQDYYYFRSIFHDCYLKAKLIKSKFRRCKSKNKKKNIIVPNFKQLQDQKISKGNMRRRMRVANKKKMKDMINRKVQEVVGVKRHQDVFHYCIQRKKRIYTLTLAQMMERYPKTLPKFLRELIDLMEEVMHLQIDPDEHFINYRMLRFRESNRAKQIIQLNDKEEQPIYFGLDQEDVQQNKRVDIELQAAQAEQVQESMMDNEDEGAQLQDSEMKDQAEEAPHLSREQEQQRQRKMQVEMDMEMIDLNQKLVSNRNSLSNVNSVSQMDVENEGNVNSHQAQDQDEDVIDVEEGQDWESLQSSSSVGIFEDDYQQMCQALTHFGIHIEPEQQTLEQQEVQSQQEIVIDFNKMDLMQYRYYGQNDLIEHQHVPKFTKKQLKVLTSAQKEALKLGKKKPSKEAEEGKQGENQEQSGESEGEDEMMQQGYFSGGQEGSFSDSEALNSELEGSSDGQDQKEDKLQKGIMAPELEEDEVLSGFSFSSSSQSSDPNGMDQEIPSFTPPRQTTHYDHRSLSQIRQKPQPVVNQQQIIQISSDSSPLGRSIKRQKRY